jgi:hypothetical protein
VRLRYPAADIPGMNLNFSTVATAAAPTRGRTLDHIGFEVRSLAEFSRKLAAAGVAFDERREDQSGRVVVRLVDPWGTSIEVTEGGPSQ